MEGAVHRPGRAHQTPCPETQRGMVSGSEIPVEITHVSLSLLTLDPWKLAQAPAHGLYIYHVCSTNRVLGALQVGMKTSLPWRMWTLSLDPAVRTASTDPMSIRSPAFTDVQARRDDYDRLVCPA